MFTYSYRVSFHLAAE